MNTYTIEIKITTHTDDQKAELGLFIHHVQNTIVDHIYTQYMVFYFHRNWYSIYRFRKYKNKEQKKTKSTITL